MMPMRTWQGEKIKIYNVDFLKLKTPSNFVDLIITSPPYNLGIDYGVYEDTKTYKDYLNFSKNWLTKCLQILKDDGRICINIPLDTGKNGKRSLSADLTVLAKKIGFKYKTTIIWNKGNSKSKFALGSFASASAPNMISPVEVILVFYKKNWKKENKGNSDITKKEFMDWTNGLWSFIGENPKRVGHPVPFPVEIPRRLIKLLSFTNDLIFDPFCGSGTTLLACLMYNRRAIGTDIDERYFEIAKNRLINKKW
jgi:site-specific DNA-methyltransferase (adenine-specific)